MTQPPRQTVLSVQYLRGFAALLVVLHHARNPAPWLFSPLADFDFGLIGVDLFFFISGFIMWTAARSEPVLDFARRRILRVAPLYWLATLGFLAFSLVATPEEVAGWSVTDLIRSLLFIPHFSGSHPGEVWPILVPGWTLQYEMFFYALFGIGLASRRVLIVVPALILALVGLGVLVQPQGAILATYTNPILLEFLGGVLIGATYRRLSQWSWPLLPLGAVLLLLAASPLPPEGLLPLARFTGSAAVLLGALALESLIRKPSWLPMQLGNASYSIYLSHTVTLQFVRAVWKHLPLTGWVQFVGFMAVAVVASVVVGWLVYALVERPMGRALSGLSVKRVDGREINGRVAAGQGQA